VTRRPDRRRGRDDRGRSQERRRPGSRRPFRLLAPARAGGLLGLLVAGLLLRLATTSDAFALQRVEGRIFAPMAHTVVSALLGAMIVSFTLVPALAFFALRRHKAVKESPVLRVARRAYDPVLMNAMRNPFAVFVAAGALLFAGIELAPRLGTEFLPELNEGALYVTFALPGNTSLTEGPEWQRHLQLAPADQTTVVGRANDQVGAVVTRRDEQRVDVGLAISDHNQACGGLDRLLRLGQGGQPALALTLDVGTFARFPAFGRHVACPDRLLHQAQWDAIDGCRQRGMDFQPTAAGVVKEAQPCRLWMGGVDELGGVLQHQHRIVVLDTAAGGVAMGRTNGGGSDLVGSEKPIGGFGGSPRVAGVRNAGRRVGQLIGHDADKALGKPGIAEVGGRQFLGGPALVIWE